jgi:hypothetical protein
MIRVLQCVTVFTGCCSMLQGVTWCYRVLPVLVCYGVLQGVKAVAGCYRVLRLLQDVSERGGPNFCTKYSRYSC